MYPRHRQTADNVFRVFRAMVLAALTGWMTAAPGAEKARKAYLQTVVGTVLVNQTERYVAGESGIRLRPGDRVITLDQSAASVIYTPLKSLAEKAEVTCRVELTENSRVTINDGIDCAHRIVTAADDVTSGSNQDRRRGEDPFGPGSIIRCTFFDCLQKVQQALPNNANGK